MRSTFSGLDIARSAVIVNQIAQDVVANNIANIDTEGYTRQRVVRAATAVTSSANRVSSGKLGNYGSGVEAQSITQVRDSFLDKCYRDQNAISSSYGKKADILNDILSVFPDAADITDSSGLIGGLETLFTNLNTFIQSPTSGSEANLVKSAFLNLTQILNQLDHGITTVLERQTEDLQSTVSRTNDLLSQISAINDSIAADATVTANSTSKGSVSNELLDKRNLLLDELSSYGNISVSNNADGTVNVELGGKQVVGPEGFDSLTMYSDKNGYVAVSWRTSGENVSLTGGTIKAYIDVINGRGSNIQSSKETTVQGIPYYRDRINLFARALADVANNTIPDQVDAAGNVIAYKTLLGGYNPDGTAASGITAGNISVSSEWNYAGAGYIVFSAEENVEDYAQLLSNRLFESNYTFASFGENYNGTFSNYVIDIVGKIGTDVSFNKGRNDASQAIANDYLSSRDSVAGVQQDEETANMLVFQRSYQAAARLMTVMDEMLDKLINGMGLVGR